MPSGLAFSTDVLNRNNRKDRYQATMNNMDMERGRMRKEPDNQSSGKVMATLARKTAAAASAFRRGNEDPYDSESDLAYHFSYFVQDQLEARLANFRAASAVEYCDPLWSPSTILCFPDIFAPQPTFNGLAGRTSRYLQQSLTTDHATTTS